VDRFIQTSLLDPGNGLARTIFIEPSLGAARPDIVIVDWDNSVANSWPEERYLLTRTDLRLVQRLFLEGPLPEERIQYYFPKQSGSSLVRLETASLVKQIDQKWRLRDLTEIFAVRHITALEAKISAMSRALEQAYFNTWFASESYILASVRRPATSIFQKAQYYGIGLWPAWGETCLEPSLLPKKYKLPQSHASWFFNELVWKTHLGLGNEC
jgi:hypothetical protein